MSSSLNEKHDVALAVIVQEAEILLTHRHPQRKWYPGCWDLPGGHIEGASHRKRPCNVNVEKS